MSLEHIPKCIWWPLSFLIGAVGCFVIVLTVMMGRAKYIEIDLSQYLKLLAGYTDEQIEINNSLQSTVSQLEAVRSTTNVKNMMMSKNTESQSLHSPYSGTAAVSNLAQTSLTLEANKHELETINNQLKRLKEQLTPRKANN